MSKGIEKKTFDGSGLKIGVVTARWNSPITHQLRDRCVAALQTCGVAEIVQAEVPGAFELPFGAQQMIQKHSVDAVVPIGCLIKGETAHFDVIAHSVAQGIQRVGLKTGVPAIFGVLTCMSEEQAITRASTDHHDHGYEWGLSAVEMASLVRSQ